MQALVKTDVGICFTRDISPGGACIIGPAEMKEKLDISKTLELDIYTTHGTFFLKPINLHCRGDVIRISEPSPYVTEFAVRFHGSPSIRFRRAKNL